MGFRFRKSFKIAPGVKFNINKKSVGMTFGTKGAHYTVNSKGKRTKSVGIPGTGISYTTSSGEKGLTSSNHEVNERGEDMKNKKGGCLSIFIILLLLSLAIAVYSFVWIPAIGALIYFIVSKKHPDTRMRNIIASIAVIITSLIVCVWLGSTQDLTSVDAKWMSTEYDISENTTVTFVPTPSDAKIESIELVNNDIATMKQEGNAAVVTFKNIGTETLTFKVNGIESNQETITVKDKAAEELAAKKAEEERIAAQQAEQERIAQEQAAQQAEQEQAAQQQAAQQPQEQMVWISATGDKYHSKPNCGQMNPDTSYQMTLSEAQANGYEPCKRCH